MLRILPTAFLLATFLSVQANAQEWAIKMFNTLKHDFGTVARGADAVYQFKVKNIYQEEIHLSNIRSTCGCTIASIEHGVIKTNETGYVVARLNTPMFTGFRSATLTVTVSYISDQGKQISAEVQLHCYGTIRGDIVFTPGSAKFTNVDQGIPHEKTIHVTYAGRNDWKIIDVKSISNNYEVELFETNRERGHISYDLLIRLKDITPAGYLKDQLVLVTNDHQNRRIPLDVEGRVIPEISVSPQPFVLGEIPKGERVTKTLVVRGKKPFKITGVDCDGGCLTFHADNESKSLHVVKVTFDSCHVPAGKVVQAIRINTDRGNHIGAVLTAYATIVHEEAARSPAEEEEEVRSEPEAGGEATQLDVTEKETSPADGQGAAKAIARG